METTLQSIFTEHFPSFGKEHKLSVDQWKAAQAIRDCGQAVLGAEHWQCANDEHVERVNHSCRHRSCPRCYGAYSEAWLERARSRLLPCDHFHLVFTLPHELNELWQFNRAWAADRLMKAAVETVRELLADAKYLGAEVGIIAAVHTWGRTLTFHPHVHLLVSGGGLHGGEWRGAKNDYLLPVGVLKAKFRGKWLAWLNEAEAAGELRRPSGWTDSHFLGTLRRVAKKSWAVRVQSGYRKGGRRP